MKAISVKQPFAWALFHGKPVENRDWPWRYRGPLIIQASKTTDLFGFQWIKERFPELYATMPHPDDLPHMALVGKVQMVDCVSFHPSPWFVGPWGHVYENPVEFKTPIPWKGKQGPFEVPDSIIEEALNELR